MEDVFKALADPTRRALLDLLAERDGRTLHDLEGHFEMTRFGVMKHLKLLEEAGLVTAHKVGREKYHYLNPVPLQLVYDRWVSRYAQPTTQRLSALKRALEEEGMEQAMQQAMEQPMEQATQDPRPSHVYAIVIRTSAQKLWQAITDPDFTRRYYYGSAVESDWQPGSAYLYLDPSGTPLIGGQILESEPPTRLKMSFRSAFAPGGLSDEVPASVVTYLIEPQGELCTLTLTHEGLDPESPATADYTGTSGWTLILSGLKTLLETGQPMSAAR